MAKQNARLNIYCFNAVIGTTYTPSGLLYAAFVNPQITQRTDGAFPFSSSICFFKFNKSFAAFSI